MIIHRNPQPVSFLHFRIPGLWQGVDYEKPAGEKKTGKQAAAIALGAVGLLSLTIQFLMAPTHIIGGTNYTDAWHTALTLHGLVLILGGVATAVYTEFAPLRCKSLAENNRRLHLKSRLPAPAGSFCFGKINP